MRLWIGYASILFAVAVLLPGTPDALAAPLSDRLMTAANDRTSSEFPSFQLFTVSITEFPGAVEDPIPFAIGTRSGTHDATFNTAVALVEPGGGISDIVELMIVSTSGLQTWSGQFISDSEGGTLTLPTNAFVV